MIGGGRLFNMTLVSKKNIVGNDVERLCEIGNCDIPLYSAILVSGEVVYGEEQLGLAGVSRAEAVIL